jgi:hypothetical protein
MTSSQQPKKTARRRRVQQRRELAKKAGVAEQAEDVALVEAEELERRKLLRTKRLSRLKGDSR